MAFENTAVFTAEEINRIATDETTEHISLGEDFTVLAGAEEPRKVKKKLGYKNLLTRRRTELTIYEEGYLRVRRWKGDARDEEYMVSLRFLAPRIRASRHIPMRILQIAGGFAGFGLLCSLIAYLAPWDVFFIPAAILGGVGAVSAATIFLYLAHEKTMFSTASGNAVVLTLYGTADSFKRCRSMVPAIIKAIEDAQAKNTQDRSDYLRHEMREHYRLREHGVIDHDVCGAATKKILSEFG